MLSVKKRFLTLLLVLAIALSLCPAAFASGLNSFQKLHSFKDGQFADLPSSHWAYNNIRSAYEYGLMNGKSDSTFAPDGNMTVAEAITISARLHSIYHNGSESFVQGSPWYQCYVDYALANGLITGGYGNYDNAVQRWEFAQILGRAFPDEALKAINTVDDGAIPDVPMSASYARDVYRLYRAGILTGNDDSGTFAPNSNILRSEASALLSRMVETQLRMSVTLQSPSKITEDEAKEMDSLVHEVSALEDKLESQGKSKAQMTDEILSVLEDKPFVSEAVSGEDGNITVRTDFGVTAIWQYYDEEGVYLDSLDAANALSEIGPDEVRAMSADMKDGVDMVLLAPYAGTDDDFIMDGYEWLLNYVLDEAGLEGSLTILRDGQVDLSALKKLDKYDMVFFYSHGALSCVTNSAWAILPSDPYTMTGEFADAAKYILFSEDFFYGRTIVDLSTGRIGVGGNFYKYYYGKNDLDGIFFHFGSCNSMRTDKLADGLISRGAAWVEGYSSSVTFNNDFKHVVGVVGYMLEGSSAEEAVALTKSDPECQEFAQDDCVMKSKGGEFRLPMGPSDEELVKAVLAIENDWYGKIWTNYGIEIYFMDLTLDGVPEFILGQMWQGTGNYSELCIYQYQNGKMVEILPTWVGRNCDELTLCRDKSNGSLFYRGNNADRSGFAWNGFYWYKFVPQGSDMDSTLLFWYEHLVDDDLNESDNYFKGEKQLLSKEDFDALKSAFENSYEDLGTPRGKVLDSWNTRNSYNAKYDLLLSLLKDIPVY